MSPVETPRVTVIVPCANEEAAVPPLLERLRAMRERPETGDWHYLFIDDGSTDDTLALLLRAERDEPWIEVLHHHDNLGLGAALRTGFAHCRSPIVCTIDSDCTYPPERLPELTRLIEQGFDIATASAWHPANRRAEGEGLRLLLSRSLSRVYQALVAQDVHTFTCLFRAYRREVIERMAFRVDGFASVAEIMLDAMVAGFKIVEVPMPLEPRRYGESKLRVADAIAAHIVLLAMTSIKARFGRPKKAKTGNMRAAA